MASTIYLVSAALMVLLLLAVVGAVVGRNWKAYTPSLRNEQSVWSALAGNETVWTLVFLVAALAVGGGAALFVSGDAFSGSLVSAGGAAVGVALAAAFLFYLFYGTYAAAKARGYRRAAAVMAASWVLGLLVVGAITVNLLTG
ncbi:MULTISPECIES: hypothetical protein [Halolamina]|uniref:Uncharacterized protein n=1 Tax=Halolamina pelagica TaxID=699431 RepID=A0A1I5V3P1_9EURY|nr:MULTISPECIES: hypothetical protein [Halolamina]NHX37882.1 hypothetical protein [Halolamina sp. R1-12]SFQ02071.1 hypothetical protein SAMN05216277_11611 [Halolamina pelagica]